jgi:AraC-like DNA-binding protein
LYGTYAVSSPGTRVLYDAAVGIALRMVGELTGGSVKPTEAHFSQGAEKDRPTYTRLLNLPVRFNQLRTGVTLDAAAMRTKLPTADPVERQRLLEMVQDKASFGAPDFAAKVRHSIRQQLNYDGPKMTVVARELGLHPRTLRRRLEHEGQTFERLRDTLRYTVACELLELTSIPIAEVAAFLGFASPGVFSKAFSRWSGTSPSIWRRNKQAPWSAS